MIHGGAFLSGTAADNRYECQVLARYGWHVISVDYPLGDYQAGLDYIRRRVVRGRTVALGISAGATYAAHLTTLGDVRGAVAVGPGPTSLTNAHVEDFLTRNGWLARNAPGRSVPDVPPEMMARGPRSTPLLIVHDPRDPAAPYWSSQHLARHTPRVRLAVVYGVQPHVPTLREWAHVGVKFLVDHSWSRPRGAAPRGRTLGRLPRSR